MILLEFMKLNSNNNLLFVRNERQIYKNKLSTNSKSSMQLHCLGQFPAFRYSVIIIDVTVSSLA